MAQNYGLGRGLSSLIPQKPGTDNAAPQKPSSTPTPTRRVQKSATEQPHKRSAAPAALSQVADDAAPTPQRQTAAMQAEDAGRAKEVDIASIVPNPQQPRVQFDEEHLESLTASIKEHGILQPPVVTKLLTGGYELIAGERRLQAAKRAGLLKMPVVIHAGDLDEKAKLELALIENIQRHDLSLVEEAKGYKKLAEEFSLSQQEIATRTGKSRSVVANRMRLLDLPVDVQRALIDQKITEGHAKAILGLPNSQKQLALFDLILAKKLTVREAEAQVSKHTTPVSGSSRIPKPADARALEDQLQAYFKTKVSVDQKGDSGKITLSYFSREELKGILSKLKI